MYILDKDLWHLLVTARNFQTFKIIYVLKRFDNYYILINGRIEIENEIKVDRVFIVSEQLLH